MIVDVPFNEVWPKIQGIKGLTREIETRRVLNHAAAYMGALSSPVTEQVTNIGVYKAGEGKAEIRALGDFKMTKALQNKITAALSA